MKLRAFRTERELSVADVARALSKPHETVRRWDNDEAVPRRAEVRQIYIWSNGAVGPDDWYDLSDLPTEPSAGVEVSP